MGALTLGVVSSSRKENEHRVPIHPRHLDRIEPELRGRILLESGYGERFGVPDDQLAPYVGGFRTRSELLATADVVLLPKPTLADLEELREGGVLWGWPHCVQDSLLTQLAIDRHLTLIAWEAMNHWAQDGTFGVHVFHKNNELAGYCSVLHAAALLGITGHYGRRRRAVVISFGATGRGAVTALLGLGLYDVTVLTQRDVPSVVDSIPGVLMGRFERTEEDPRRCQVLRQTGPQPMAEFLAEHDLLVNCVFQDTDAPLLFVTDDDLPLFDPGTLLVDVSCDEGMAFSFARPTSFAQPMFTVGDDVRYYAVDHSPSYLWDAASWEISEALLPYVPTVLSGPAAWDGDQTLRRAIEIRDGVVQNLKILSFQDRELEHPHPRR
jgi:alanine dehydrogenase